MGEGGGFPQVQAVVSHVSPRSPVVSHVSPRSPVVSHVSPRSPVACPSIESAPKCELTNLLIGLMQVRVIN
jgi:hypothetical protein